MTIDVSGLRTKLAGAVYTPGDEKYEHALKHWASNVDRPAAVVAQVTTANDVSAAVRFVLRPRLRSSCNLPMYMVWMSPSVEDVMHVGLPLQPKEVFSVSTILDISNVQLICVV